MGNIADYQKVETVAGTDTLLMETENGTRGILASTLSKRMLELIDIHGYCGMMNNVAKNNPAISAIIRRNVWRGSNIGTSITTAQYEAIANQTFDNMFCGDYWILNGNIFRIMDFNYWMNTGDTRCITPHVVLMPDKASIFGEHYMSNVKNPPGYGDTYLRNNYMYNKSGCVDIVLKEMLGETHLLQHREYLQNTISSIDTELFNYGYPSSGRYYYSRPDLPNEIMVYGTYIFSPNSIGHYVVDRTTNSKIQLAGFRLNPAMIRASDAKGYWLRDYVGGASASSASFTCVNEKGLATYIPATSSLGIRPVFGICKEVLDSSGGTVA